MRNERKQKTVGQLLLLLTCFLWGTSFFVLDKTLDRLPVLFVLFVRFFTSAVILFIIGFKRFLHLKKRTAFIGLLLGATLATAYLFQTYGLKWENPVVTPGENAFLTSTYTVMVPFMCWIFFRKKPSVFSIIAAAVCVVGIAFVNVTDTGLTFGPGQVLSLISAVFFGLQILIISRFVNKDDGWVILTLEMLTVGGASVTELPSRMSWLTKKATPAMAPKRSARPIVARIVRMIFFVFFRGTMCSRTNERFFSSFWLSF